MKKPTPKTRAQVLREALQENGMTRAEAAELMGVSARTVEAWLARPESLQHRSMPERALRLFNLSLSDFLVARIKARECGQ